MDALTSFLLKDAEVSGTPVMPAAAGADPSSKDTSATKTLPKVAGCVPSRVNVAGKEAPTAVQTKEAQLYALPSQKRYPLDQYDHVKTACAYFDQWCGEMILSERHEFASNLVKRAHALGIEVPSSALRYGGTERADSSLVAMSLDARVRYIEEGEKRASFAALREVLHDVEDPQQLAQALEEFDKLAGIDHLYGSCFPDPYSTAYASKEASTLSKSPTGSLVVGNDYLDTQKLKNFMNTGYSAIEDLFGADVANEMVKDPVGVFNSLPIPQQKLVMRRVTDNGPSETLAR